jgi:hypothetical protein
LNALPKGNVDRLARFLSDEKLRSRARDQFYNARIDGMRLLDWLRARLDKPETVWDLLSDRGLPTYHIGDVQSPGRENTALARELTLRMIAGVLHRAGKELGYD